MPQRRDHAIFYIYQQGNMYVEKNQGYRPTKHARTEKTNNAETAVTIFNTSLADF